MEKKLIILPDMQPEVAAKSRVRLKGRFILKDSQFSYSAKLRPISSTLTVLHPSLPQARLPPPAVPQASQPAPEVPYLPLHRRDFAWGVSGRVSGAQS